MGSGREIEERDNEEPVFLPADDAAMALVHAAARCASEAQFAQTRMLEWIAAALALALVYLAGVSPLTSPWSAVDSLVISLIGVAAAMMVTHEADCIRSARQRRRDLLAEYCALLSRGS